MTDIVYPVSWENEDPHDPRMFLVDVEFYGGESEPVAYFYIAAEHDGRLGNAFLGIGLDPEQTEQLRDVLTATVEAMNEHYPRCTTTS